jgi:hypothetical protein
VRKKILVLNLKLLALNTSINLYIFKLTEVMNSIFDMSSDMSLNGALLGAMKRLRGSHVG